MLRPEFPDVTISKIRFLESQGLIEPERTASGYRKFYEADIGRLRWILQQQKDKYLPLRVIRGKLDEEGGFPSPPSAPALGSAPALAVAPDPRPLPLAEVIRHPSAPMRVQYNRPAVTAVPNAPLPASSEASSTAKPVPSGEPWLAGAGGSRERSEEPFAVESFAVDALTGVSMTLEELVRASGLSAAEIAQLEELGLVSSRGIFSETYYDDDALLACRLTAGFLRHGVETRHLRMYKMAADREASFFEQIVTPMLRRKDVASRASAIEILGELGRLGEQMRSLALRQALRRSIEPAPPRPRGRAR